MFNNFITTKRLFKNLTLANALAMALGSTVLVGSSFAAPNVVASIKPIHAIVSAVMGSVGTPHLLVQGGASPHTYSLRPQDAQALQQADLIVFVGHELELFMEKSLQNLPQNSENLHVLELMDVDGLTLLATRETSDAFNAHAEEEDDEGEHEVHKTAAHDHGAVDPHIWLSPENGIILAKAIAQSLMQIDQNNAQAYQANLEVLVLEISEGAHESRNLLADKNQNIIMFHDAFQYFERAMDVNVVAVVSLNPDLPPSAGHIAELRHLILDEGANCLFVEPQFEPRLAQSLVEGTQVTISEIDPLGKSIENGPSHYPQLLAELSHHIAACSD